MLVGQYDPCTGPACCQGSREPGGTTARNQHIAVRVAMLVAIRLFFLRRPAETRGCPDDALIQAPPGPRPHESLVIEAGTEDFTENIVDRPEIEAGTRPAFGGPGDQASVEFHLCRSQIRLCVRSFADLHDGIRLLGAAAHDTAWPPQLETAADDRDTVRE